jgi:hypothetical protein
MYGDNMSETVFNLEAIFGNRLTEVGVGKMKRMVKAENGDSYTLEVSVAMIPNKPLYQDRAWLTKEYVDKQRTMQEIADQFGVTPMSIHGWIRKFDIPSRPRGRRTPSN